MFASSLLIISSTSSLIRRENKIGLHISPCFKPRGHMKHSVKSPPPRTLAFTTSYIHFIAIYIFPFTHCFRNMFQIHFLFTESNASKLPWVFSITNRLKDLIFSSFDAGMNMTHNDVHVCLVNNDLDNVCDSLDQEITQLEVQDAIRALKSNKAAGPDGFSGEFYKYSAPSIITFFTKYFNKLFEAGTFPSQCANR